MIKNISKILIVTVFCFFININSCLAVNTKSIALVSDSSQYLSISNASQTGLGITGDISIMGWIKIDTLSANTTILAKDSGTNGYLLRQLSGKINFLYRNSSDNTNKYTTNAVFTNNTWHHFAVTADVSAKDIKFYVDGSEIVEVTSVLVGASSIGANTEEFQIGARIGATFFNGKFDEIGVYSAILSSATISSEYNSGNGTDRSSSESNIVAGWRFEDDLLDVTSNDNDLTNNNSATYSTDVPFSGSTPATTRRTMIIN